MGTKNKTDRIAVPWDRECEYCMCENKCTFKKATKQYKERLKETLDMTQDVYGEVKFNCAYFFIQPEIAQQIQSDMEELATRDRTISERMLIAMKYGKGGGTANQRKRGKTQW